MLSEALVIFACVTSHGCSETSNQYALENPELVHRLEDEAKSCEKMVGPETVNTLGPLIYFVGGGTANIKLQESLYLQINKQQGILTIKKTFK